MPGEEAVVADDAEHQVIALRERDVVADDAVGDHAAGADGDVVADVGWPLDDGGRIDAAVAANLDQFGV